MTSDLQRLPLELVDPSPWFAFVSSRYGLPAATFDDYLLIRPSRRRLSLVRRDAVLPIRPATLAVGLPFLYINRQPPRLTTATALRFGHQATRNTVTLQADQVDLFLAAVPFALTTAQRHLDDGGHVIVNWDGLVLGIGFYRASQGTIEGELPKPWRAQRAAASGAQHRDHSA